MVALVGGGQLGELALQNLVMRHQRVDALVAKVVELFKFTFVGLNVAGRH